MYQSIDERIEALVHFKNGRLKPLRFRWKNQTYPIHNITTTYQTKSGQAIHQVFSVQSGGNLYELVYDPQHQTWTLNQIYLDG